MKEYKYDFEIGCNFQFLEIENIGFAFMESAGDDIYELFTGSTDEDVVFSGEVTAYTTEELNQKMEKLISRVQEKYERF